MSTSSLVCYKEGETIDVSYVHYDGFIRDGVGETLIKHYNTEDRASLFKIPRSIDTIYKSRLGGEYFPDKVTFPDTIKAESRYDFFCILNSGYNDFGAEIVFLWEGGEWFVSVSSVEESHKSWSSFVRLSSYFVD